MEDMHPSPDVLQNCGRVLDGEITYEQYIMILKDEYADAKHVAV
jgi:hypothetical protein